MTYKPEIKWLIWETTHGINWSLLENIGNRNRIEVKISVRDES